MSDTDTTRSYLSWRFNDLQPGESINIRTITNGTAANHFYGSVEDAASFIAGDGVNVYAGINQRSGNDGTKAGVKRVDILHADVDDKAYPDGRAGALAAIDALPVPPSIVIDSGGGLYPLWRLAASVPTPTPTEGKRLESLMTRMYDRLGLTSGTGVDRVQDLSRILRVPGTCNWKYDPARPVSIFRFNPELAYDLETLEAAFPAPAEAAIPEPPAAPRVQRDRVPSHDDIRGMLRYIPAKQAYDEWLRCLMAVHSLYPGADGVALIEQWSPGTDGEVAEKFAGFKRGDGVGIGTLVEIAKQYGWQPTGASKTTGQATPPAAAPWDLASVKQVAEALPAKTPERLNFLRAVASSTVGLRTAKRQAWRDT
ncbi:MAG: PriCT-2 domain-containing protein, partial [Chloroflexota bacterium]